MAFDLQAGFGAGAGADMLQQILRQKAQEAFQNQTLANEQQKMALLQQEQQQRAAIQQAQLESINEERKTNEAAKNRAIFGELPPGTALDPATAAMGRSVGLGPLIPHEAASLPSTDISGNVTPESTAAGGQALKMVGLHPEQDTYLGNATQQDALRRRQDIQNFLSNPELSPEARLGIQYEQMTGKNAPGPLLKPTSTMKPVYDTGPGGQLVQIGQVPTDAVLRNPVQSPQDHYTLQTVPDPSDPTKTIVVRVDTTSGAASPVTMGGVNLSGKSGISPQARQMAEGSKTLLEGAVPRAEKAAQALQDAGLFGVVASKARDLLGGQLQAGTLAAQLAGNDAAKATKLAGLIGQFTTQLGLLQTGVARVHGGARGGGSPAMLEHMQHIMGGSGDLPTFLGHMQAVRDQLGDYEKEGGLTPSPSSAPPLSATDLLKKYGG